MSDDALSEGGGNSSVAEATPSGSAGGEASSESMVTPELQAKFDQVFGGKDAAADREAGKGPTGQKKNPQQQAKQKQQKHYFDGDDDTSDDDTPPANQPQPKQGQQRKQPGSPQPQNSTASRSRVSNQLPAGQSDDPSQQQQGDEGDQPTLNPVLKRAALRAKWDADVVQEFWEKDPDLAEKTFAQLHRSQNELSSRFAQLGQMPNQPQQQPGYSQQPPRGQSVNPAAPQMSNDPNAIMQMMTEVYGGQESFQKLNSDWNNAIPTLIQPFVERVLMPQQQMLQQAMTFIAGQERQNIAKEATMWFDGVKEDFGEMYGLGTTTPSQEQMQVKRALTLTADRIRNGARTQGIQMTVSEALEQAHLMLAADHYQEVERKRITAQIKRRSASITARPTQRKAPAVSGTGAGPEKSIQAAQEAYAAKLAELGIDQ